jgi:hypothetical protein
LASTSRRPRANLNQTFSTLLNRVQQTGLQVDEQLASYYQDVPGNWDVSFTANGQTVALFDLADPTSDGTFPAQRQTQFGSLAVLVSRLAIPAQ